MQDFASAAMVRLLVRAMRQHGLVPPPAAAVACDGPQGSLVPLTDKRAVVQALVQQGGLAALLRLAQRVDLLKGDPVHSALLGAQDLPALLARWQRLERYVHSRHQVSLQGQGSQHLELLHQARDARQPPPQPAESLAVLGVLLGAGQALGVLGLSVEWPGSGAAWDMPPPGAPHDDAALNALLAQPVALGRAGQWVLRWQPGRSPAEEAATPVTPAITTGLCDALPWPPLARQLACHVLQDPAAPHGVQALARQAGMAGRSLQRALASSGLSCRSIVTEARARAAAQWLLEGRHGLAEIGFACGFADQPHFTREFARHVGLTPARYRDAFAT